VQPVEQFLARDLRREAAHRRVGDLIFRIVPRPGRRMRGEPCLEIVDAVAARGRQHEGRVELRLGVDPLRQRQQ
jgi:hypothetical protein